MKTNVFEIKSPPTLKKPDILKGICDKAAAEAWGVKNGYAVVYYMPGKQKVYAEKLQAKVDEQAKALEDQSAQLVMFAESGA